MFTTQAPAKPPRGAVAYLAAAADQSIPNSTDTKLAFTQEHFDTDTIHDNAVNNTRLTVPAGVTKVQLITRIMWEGNTTGIRTTAIRMNNTDITPNFAKTEVYRDAPDANPWAYEVSTPPITVVAGDYFEVLVNQNSGGALAARWYGTSFEMKIIE